jgi:hypothetical protein
VNQAVRIRRSFLNLLKGNVEATGQDNNFSFLESTKPRIVAFLPSKHSQIKGVIYAGY